VHTVLAAREGESVEDTTKAYVADGAEVTHSSETGGDNDNDNEVELSAYLSRSSPFLAGCPPLCRTFPALHGLNPRC